MDKCKYYKRFLLYQFLPYNGFYCIFFRATGISALARAGFEGREIQRVSGHKKLENLSVYNRASEVDRFKYSISMQHGKLSVFELFAPHAYCGIHNYSAYRIL